MFLEQGKCLDFDFYGVEQTFSIDRHWLPELQEYSPEDVFH